MGGEATGPVAVVTGSPAADLDSIVASICYAYLLDREGGSAGSVCPYLPIPHADLPLRPEALYLFDRVGMQPASLVFADDVVLKDLLEARQGELVLVDTQGHDLAAVLRGRVAEVIDHRPVEETGYAREEEQSARDRPSGYHVENTGGGSFRQRLRRRIVEPVGSACTLVAEQIFQRKPGILDRQSATLLLAAVLLDTVNLDPEAERATEKDRKTAGLLIQAGAVDIAGLYEELAAARSSVEGLSSTQLLRKDYKEGTTGAVRFGMSSVPLLLDSWRQRDERLEEALSGFLAEKALDLLVVLLYRQGEGFKRQLVFCSTGEQVLHRVVSCLEKPLGLTERTLATEEGEELQGTCPAGGRSVVIRSFAQREGGVSRKQIEPRLRQILESP